MGTGSNATGGPNHPSNRRANSPAMIATKDDIEALTGYKRKSCQIEWLRANGYPFQLGADGHPRVLVSVIQEKLGGRISSPEPRLHFPDEAA